MPRLIKVRKLHSSGIRGSQPFGLHAIAIASKSFSPFLFIRRLSNPTNASAVRELALYDLACTCL